MDYTFNDTMSVPYEKMLRVVTKVFVGYGMREDDAAVMADTLVNADARGVYSHGCMRTSIYCKRVEEGGTSATARPELVRAFGATAIVDGHNAMGQIVTCFATEQAIEIAKKFGCATVSVKGSNHHGACAYYALKAAEQDMLAFVGTVGCCNIMAPWGGTEPKLGNNPFAVAAPCLERPPVVLDMAQSVVARGKIVMARKTGAAIPESWALDEQGHPTTDPEKAYRGTVRPIGDYKGYGLSFMNAVFSGLLAGTGFGTAMGDFYELPAVAQNDGHIIYLVDICSFDDPTAFKRRMDEAIADIKSSRLAAGTKEILVPGEPEFRNLERQLREGITYPMEVIEELQKLCVRCGIDFEKEMRA